MDNQHTKAVATAIANARGNRRGVPSITNVLDILPAKLREEVMDDAKAVVQSLGLAVQAKGLSCPFCADDDFDDRGLKDHILHKCLPFQILDPIR